MVIPCLCSLPFESCAVHHKTAVIPVDIPTRWEPRAKQSRTVALLTALCAAALFESCTATTKKVPRPFGLGTRGGALSTALEPNTSSRVTVLASSVKLKLSTTRSSKT